ncbi:MAG: 4-hydroxybenzoyl-CoA reductase subunit beta [Proteobacteria bacterium]|nr:4-hydroxybenzoyl-CoA reductase subunit beta [Pseudomonadota bacterium]
MMLPLPEFDLLVPTSLDEAVSLLAAHPEAKLVAGGTDLIPSMKQRLFTPPTVISLSRVPELRASGDGFLGAGVTLREVAAMELGALSSAARGVATSTIQRMATLGGNLMLDTRCRYYNQSEFWRGSLGQDQSGCLKCDDAGICHVAPTGTGCYAAHSADTVPVLIALGAEVELVSPRGPRRLALQDLYEEDGRTWLTSAPDEILTRVFLPADPPDVAFRKLRARGAIDYPLLLVAVTAERAVLSAIGPRPIEVDIAGMTPEQAGEAAFRAAQPLSTHVWSALWRKKMIRVEVKRACTDLHRGSRPA